MADSPYQSPTEQSEQPLRRPPWWLPWLVLPFLLTIALNATLISQFRFSDEPDGIDVALFALNFPAIPFVAMLGQFSPPPTEETVYQRLAILCLSGSAAWGMMGLGLGWLRRRLNVSHR